MRSETICYVDESVHESVGIVVTAFVFAEKSLETMVDAALAEAGLDPEREEFKSSARMDSDQKMRKAREKLMFIAGQSTKIAVFFGPSSRHGGSSSRHTLGRQSLQALQSVLIRNSIPAKGLLVYFDEGIFWSSDEAKRLYGLFHSLSGCDFFPEEDSKKCLGIQIADAVAHIVRSEVGGIRVCRGGQSIFRYEILRGES